MDLDTLLVFAIVAREGSFTRAALALGVSQPSISERMQRLEQHLGTPAFVRRGRGVALTAEGLALRAMADRALTLARETDEFVAGLSDLERGLVRGAASTTIAGYVLPTAIARLRAKRPGVEVDIAVGNTAEMAEAVERGDVGWALVEGPVAESRLSVRRFRDDELILIVAASHPWARRRRAIAPSALADEAFIAREPGSGTGAVVERALADAGIQLAPRVRIADSRGIAEAVAAGAGVGIVSEFVAASLLHSGQLARVAIAGLSLVRPLSLVQLPGRTLGRLDRELLGALPSHTRFFGDEIRLLFRKEYLHSLDAPHAARVRKGVIEPIRALRREDLIAGPPQNAHGHGRLPKRRLDAEERIRFQPEHVPGHLCLAEGRAHQRSEITVERIVGRIRGIVIRRSERILRRAGQRLVRDDWRKRLVGECPLVSQLEYRLDRFRRRVDDDVAIREQQRPHALRVMGHEQLGDRAAAVVRDEIDAVDGQLVEQRRQHGRLLRRRQVLVLGDFRVPEAHEVRRDASPIG